MLEVMQLLPICRTSGEAITGSALPLRSTSPYYQLNVPRWRLALCEWTLRYLTHLDLHKYADKHDTLKFRLTVSHNLLNCIRPVYRDRQLQSPCHDVLKHKCDSISMSRTQLWRPQDSHFIFNTDVQEHFTVSATSNNELSLYCSVCSATKCVVLIIKHQQSCLFKSDVLNSPVPHVPPSDDAILQLGTFSSPSPSTHCGNLALGILGLWTILRRSHKTLHVRGVIISCCEFELKASVACQSSRVCLRTLRSSFQWHVLCLVWKP